jgi:hypothetical protein
VGLKQLVDSPAGKHALQDATVVRVRKSNQLTGKPPVELSLARPTTSQSRIGVRGNPVVLTAKSAVILQVAMLEQHLQHNGLGVHRVDPP